MGGCGGSDEILEVKSQVFGALGKERGPGVREWTDPGEGTWGEDLEAARHPFPAGNDYPVGSYSVPFGREPRSLGRQLESGPLPRPRQPGLYWDERCG